MDCKINPDYFWGFFFLFTWTYISAEVLNYLWDTLCFQRVTSLGMNSKAGCIAGLCVQLLDTKEDCLSWFPSSWLADEKNFAILLSSWQPCQNKAHERVTQPCQTCLVPPCVRNPSLHLLWNSENRKLGRKRKWLFQSDSLDIWRAQRAPCSPKGCCRKAAALCKDFKDFPEEYLIHFPKNEGHSDSCL